MRHTNLSDLLRGLEAGRLQSVGIMQVIPLTGTEYTRIGPPDRLKVSTTGYGHLKFENSEPVTTIVPQAAAYLTKKAAQDHATPHVVVVETGRTKIDTAMCIQQTQGGYIEHDTHQLKLLPFPLRESALRVRREQSYSKLWDSIARFNRAMGVAGVGHVDVFFNHFELQLEQFVAEFEPVPRQVGAIVLINGRVVGVERVPTYAYWRALWRPLIRECYGSLALYLAHQGEAPCEQPTRRSLTGDFQSLDDLLAGLGAIEQQEEEAARAVVRGLLAEPVQAEPEEQTGAFQVETLNSPYFVGQAVWRELEPVYVSLVATEARLRMKQEMQPFTI